MTTVEKITSLRNDADYTHSDPQSDLARLLGVTRSAVNSWEMGKSLPSPAVLVQLADHLQKKSEGI